MTDIVERLRNDIHPVIQTEEEAMRMEAADEIERLRAQGEEAALAFARRREQMQAEIERLRASLRWTKRSDWTWP